MSNISIRVELPSYSQSFVVEVPDSSTIGFVKSEITRTCPGGPRVEGQRLIHAGRILRDEERIQDIWPSSQGSLTIHLAVHPSAFTTTPPSVPSSSPTTSPSPHNHQPPSSVPFATPPGYHNTSAYTMPFSCTTNTQPFIIYKHESAIAALTTNSLTSIPPYNPNVMDGARRSAMAIFMSYGWSWPTLFDEPYPSSSQDDGVKYDRVKIDGQDYLVLGTPNAKPSALQLHALKILTYTFPFLSMPPATAVSYFYFSRNRQTPGVQDLNAHLQNLGLPALRVADNGLFGEHIRAIPLRALMTPLLMLIVRTLVVVYFFAPSHTPFFAVILGAWIFYEAWTAMGMALRIGRGPQGVQRGAGPAQGNNGAIPQQNAQQPQQGVPGVAPAANNPLHNTSFVLDSLANVNLTVENNALFAQARPGVTSQPTLTHKIQTFFALLITTLHPALWDRRRTELMRREGRVRAEAALSERADGHTEAPEGDAAEMERQLAARLESRQRQERRPAWVREYVERVRQAEFTDE